MERNKVIIITVSIILGLAILGGLVWLIYWLVTKDSAGAGTSLFSDDDCNKLSKGFFDLAKTGTKIAKTDLEAWATAVFTDMPVKGEVKPTADIATADELAALFKQNREFAFLLSEIHDLYVALDTDKNGLSKDEMNPIALNNEGAKLFDIADEDKDKVVKIGEFIHLMKKGYFKHARNYMWAAGGDDHKLSVDEHMAVMFFDDKAAAETAAGTDKVFSLTEFIKHAVARMTAAGQRLDKATFATSANWMGWILSGLAEKCSDSGKFNIAKIKDNGFDVPAVAGADADKAAFIKGYTAALTPLVEQKKMGFTKA